MRRAILIGSLALVAACHDNRGAAGPAERAGRSVDGAAKKTGDALHRAAEKTDEAARKAVRATGNALEKAGRKLQTNPGATPNHKHETTEGR